MNQTPVKNNDITKQSHPKRQIKIPIKLNLKLLKLNLELLKLNSQMYRVTLVYN